MINTPVPIAIGVALAVIGGLSAAVAGFYRLVRYRRWRVDGRTIAAEVGPEVVDVSSPLRCHHGGCRFTGELFWQSRYGLVVLCRNHAYVLRNRLDYLLETLEPGSEK